MKKQYKIIFFSMSGKIKPKIRFSSKRLAIRFAEIMVSVYQLAYGYKIIDVTKFLR